MQPEEERYLSMLRAVIIAAAAYFMLSAVVVVAAFVLLMGYVPTPWIRSPVEGALGLLLAACLFASIGRGLIRRRTWAWFAGMWAGALALPMVPIGTILGVVAMTRLYRVRGEYDYVPEPDPAIRQDICPYCARELPEHHPLRVAA